MYVHWLSAWITLCAMGRRYLVLSDLHLCDVEEHRDGWKAYKRPQHLFDAELDALISRFVDQGDEGDTLTLVLNGDIVDFDLVTATPDAPPWPVSRGERKRGLACTEAKSAWKLRRVLAAHERFLDTLARFIAAGHQVVYVAGNHDQELSFPAVREELLSSLAERAEALGLTAHRDALRFERWFYFVPGEIYVEHGQQYDYYTSFRHVLDPLLDDGTLALPMGNLSSRYLMSNIGFFNPHASDYILNIYRYMSHWLRYYAFSRRGLAMVWFTGSLLVMAEMLRIKRKTREKSVDEGALLSAYAERQGLPLAKVEALDQLKRIPVMYRNFRVLREFWIDRLLMALAMIGATITLAVLEVPLWLKLGVPLAGFPLLYFLYEEVVHGETIYSAEANYPELAGQIAALLGVKVVTFGHSHEPLMMPLGRGVSYVNTGTWAPIFATGSRDELAAGYRNALFVTIDERGEATARLESLLPVSAHRRLTDTTDPIRAKGQRSSQHPRSAI